MGFRDAVVAGIVLVRAAIRSPNFITGVSGWTINLDGSAEFSNLTIRGTFFGTDFIISSAGAFFYSGAPALGNLIASVASNSGTESEGNHYYPGILSYEANGTATPTVAAQLLGGVLNIGIPAQITGTAGSPASLALADPGIASLSSGDATNGDTPAVLSLVSLAQGGPALLGSANSLSLESASGANGTPFLLLGQVPAGAPGTPSSAGALYVASDGSLHYLGPSGTNTHLANP